MVRWRACHNRRRAFLVEDVVNNEAITPTINSMWQINGKPMELEIVDDYTFICSFDDSYILFRGNYPLHGRVK